MSCDIHDVFCARLPLYNTYDSSNQSEHADSLYALHTTDCSCLSSQGNAEHSEMHFWHNDMSAKLQLALLCHNSFAPLDTMLYRV